MVVRGWWSADVDLVCQNMFAFKVQIDIAKISQKNADRFAYAVA